MSTWADKTWLVTGGSSGIGRSLAAQVLASGGCVAVTARDPDRVDLDLRERGVAVTLDLTRPETFGPALEVVTAALGTIDVLVNNAGYGLLGAIEETGDEERRSQLEANFFGPAQLTTMLLPQLRAQLGGAIVNISSVSGVVGAPGSGYYAASKHALEGWSDSLRAELLPFGVHVLVVEPGAFRTDFYGRSRRQTQLQLGIYETVDRRRANEVQMGATASGDPDRGAAAIIAALDAEQPPHRLALGSQAAEIISDGLRTRIDEIERWRDRSCRADFPH